LRPDEASAFVSEVAGLTFGGAFRMLADEVAGLDLPGAAEARRANVARYLVERTTERPVLLVGEAMGYAGGRFSGIAFTAERMLLGWGEPYAATSIRPEGYSEQSGTIVHGLLGDLGVEQRVLLWNVVPAHPHKPDQPLSNRLPTEAERRAGGEVLHALIARLDPLAVLPAGRTAERTLRELVVEAEPAVRHPANGGATRFRAEAGEALRRILAPST
jgi:Uracil DNA glycosylase superfamily